MVLRKCGPKRIGRRWFLLLMSLASAPCLADTTCQPTKLVPAVITLGSQSSVPTGWPVPIQVRVVDDCGSPINDGTVVVEFADGEPPIVLVSLGQGVWSATWQVGTNATSTVLTIAAQNAAGLAGSIQVTANIVANQTPVFSQPSFPVAVAGGEPVTQTITVTTAGGSVPFTVGTVFAGQLNSDEFTVQPTTGVTPATLQLTLQPFAYLPIQRIQTRTSDFQ